MASSQDSINEIQERIAKLQEKEAILKRKMAETLFKKITSLCGSDFSTELVLGLMSLTLKNATDSQKEEWRKAGSTFLSPSRKPKP